MDKDPQRTKKYDKQMVASLDYKDIEFLVSVKDYNKIELKNNMNVNTLTAEGFSQTGPFIDFSNHVFRLLKNNLCKL